MKLWILVALSLLAAAWVSPAQAQTTAPVRLTIEDPSFIQCNATFDGVFSASFRVIAFDASGAVTNTAPLDFVLYASTAYGSTSLNFQADSSTVVPVAVAFPGSPPIESGTIQVALAADTSLRTPVYIVDCQSATVGLPATEGVDNRLNRGAGDLINVLYPAQNASGQPTIAVWGVTASGQGYRIDAFAYALFAPYLNRPPAQVVQLFSIADSTLYALPSGEFQINVGPGPDGKIGEVIFRGMPPQVVRLNNTEPAR